MRGEFRSVHSTTVCAVGAKHRAYHKYLIDYLVILIGIGYTENVFAAPNS